MWALFAFIALAALARYPLTAAEADAQYKAAIKEYKKQAGQSSRRSTPPKKNRRSTRRTSR